VGTEDTLDQSTAMPRAGESGVIAPLAREQDRLLACVHCGFCLDACPTYTRLGMESDSPRGRLYLMRAVAEGRLEPEADAFRIHLDRCLGCRACEPVCPSGVQYGFLLERGRQVIANAQGTDRASRLLLLAVASPGIGAVVWLGGRLLRDTGLAGFLARNLPARMARLRFAMAMLAASRPWHRKDEAAAGEPSAGVAHIVTLEPPDSSRDRGTAAVLHGCVQQGLFERVNHATVRVLEANGFAVKHAPGQACCGALHAHAGHLEEARRLALRNMDAFERSGAERIVVNAAGCGALMKEYGELFEHTEHETRARAFARRVVDVNELLAGVGPRSGAAMSLRAAYDAPCHLLHAQRVDRAPMDALRSAVPGVSVTPVTRADECCGGAGIYGLTHPDLGGRILGDKIKAVQSTDAEVVLTPNPGCMMQIGAGLVLAGDDRPVLHPVEVIDESYRRARSAPAAPSSP
jgi:glycolate oxidase iron-sulfur subunit